MKESRAQGREITGWRTEIKGGIRGKAREEDCRLSRPLPFSFCFVSVSQVISSKGGRRPFWSIC